MRFFLLSLALAFALLAVTVRAEDADYADDSAEDQESFDNADQADNVDESDEADNVDEADEADDADYDDADDDADEEEKTDCSPDPKTQTKTLGGKTVSQETENISVNGRCIRVLKGGSPSEYTMAGSCAHCKANGPSFSCVGSPLARSMKCALVLGPDCNRHSVDKSDPTKAC